MMELKVMPVFSFSTIQRASQGIYKEKGSKFLAFAYPVNSESEIKKLLDQTRKKYFDARHHCYAYVLGAAKEKFKAHDDGEPNHSASDPIIGQIRSRSLTNVLVIVVRYFGGVKLGVGGLMHAYKTAAEDALNQAVIIVEEVTAQLELQFEYTRMPEVMRLVKDFDLKVIEQTFEESCLIKVVLKLRYKEEFDQQVKQLNPAGFNVIEMD